MSSRGAVPRLHPLHFQPFTPQGGHMAKSRGIERRGIPYSVWSKWPASDAFTLAKGWLRDHGFGPLLHGSRFGFRSWLDNTCTWVHESVDIGDS